MHGACQAKSLTDTLFLPIPDFKTVRKWDGLSGNGKRS
jgi:hypothetical protein